jgi:hypothetical protein
MHYRLILRLAEVSEEGGAWLLFLQSNLEYHFLNDLQ